MERNLVCNECGGGMKKGYIQDTSYMAAFQAAWIKGSFGPWKSFWKHRNEQFDIAAYRCEHCGVLKLYAGTDHSGDKQE